MAGANAYFDNLAFSTTAMLDTEVVNLASRAGYSQGISIFCASSQSGVLRLYYVDTNGVSRLLQEEDINVNAADLVWIPIDGYVPQVRLTFTPETAPGDITLEIFTR